MDGRRTLQRRPVKKGEQSDSPPLAMMRTPNRKCMGPGHDPRTGAGKCVGSNPRATATHWGSASYTCPMRSTLETSACLLAAPAVGEYHDAGPEAPHRMRPLQLADDVRTEFTLSLLSERVRSACLCARGVLCSKADRQPSVSGMSNGKGIQPNQPLLPFTYQICCRRLHPEGERRGPSPGTDIEEA